MNSKIYKFICDCEGWKTNVKGFHWNSPNLSQHNEMDSLMDEISDFQDVASEVEQSISGNLPYNKLKGTPYHMTTIQKFMKDIIATTTKFCNDLKNMGDKYIGLHSECESFLAKLQQRSYRINFTLKEDFKRQYAQKINESIEENNELLDDAREALEMSDGQIDFYEWSAAYEYDDEDMLLDVWNQACRETGYDALCESKTMDVNEGDLYCAINEAMHKVLGKNKGKVTIDEAIDKSIDNFLSRM